MISLDDAVAEEYLTESAERLSSVERDLLAIEKQGQDIDEELVNRVFRALHGVAGGSSLFDLAKIRELAHQTEDVLSLIRSHKIIATPARVSVLLRATDRLLELIQNAHTSNEADNREIIAALDKAGIKQERRMAPHLRILLVEDDFASRLLLQSFLSRYGECHIAVNGREAVDAFRAASEAGRSEAGRSEARQGYDLICMDIMMPEMDGREAVRQVRALEEAQGILSTSGAKIIMTTTVRDIKEVIRCFSELCDAYLVKPIDLGELLSQMKVCQLVQ